MSRSISCLLTWGCNNILHGVRRLLYFLHHEQLNVSRTLWFRLPPALMSAGRPEGRLDDRWGAACVTDVSLLLLLCRGTSTRRRTRRCCTEWRVCPAWAGCWRRASTRTNWSQNGRLLRRWRVDLFSNQDVFIHKWQVIYISHQVNFWGSSIEVIVRFLLFINVLIVADHRCFDSGINCSVCFWVVAVGLGHVDENAGAEERQRVHHPRRIPIVPLRNHRPQHERLLSCKFWRKRTVFGLSEPQIYK